MPLSPGHRLGPYEIQASIGAGGMGEVYKAVDTRLGRTVAIKVLPEDVSADADLRQRLEREAKSISRLNHPNICTLHDIGTQDGTDFLVMEYLEGETLAQRIGRDALPLAEAVQHGLVLLGTLEALHGLGLVHRDLKPSNIFLTLNGLKLLDFGLARSVHKGSEAIEGADLTQLTQTGMLLGTPRYMAPEALKGQPVDARADLFAVGAILYEMLSGKHAFDGPSVVDIAHAVLHDKPPLLTGSAAIVAADRVIHRALEQRVDDRYQSATAMARHLRDVLTTTDAIAAAPVHQVPRLIVLPFRMLRPDPDAEFLAFSLPDAITTSLAGLHSLVVRSPLAGGQFATDTPDLRAIATQAEVDLVLVGTLLRGGDRLQVNAQLLEAPAGTVVWSQRSQLAWQDIFQLQDELTRRIVDSLAVPLSAGEEQQLGRDVPASAPAYEHYLRANQLAHAPAEWKLARDLYLRSVDEDPKYAPAWAKLGRMHRVIAKYADDLNAQHHAEGYRQAEAAFERALALNPDLPVAHNLYTALELERGRSKQAMLRLLERAQVTSADADLFAGLVPACRYCGLMDASLAAHSRARQLDPSISTAVMFTLVYSGRYEEAAERAEEALDLGVKAECLIRLGRGAEAIAVIDQAAGTAGPAAPWFLLLRALADPDADRAAVASQVTWPLVQRGFDPEGHYLWALYMAQLGDLDTALAMLTRAVEGGYVCFPAMAQDPWLDPLRTDTGFMRLLGLAETGHREAVAAFTEAEGERVLGISLS